MSIDECNALPITRVQYEDGTPAVLSYWRPTEAEIALIVGGHPVRLSVLGATHPPLMLGVDGDGLF